MTRINQTWYVNGVPYPTLKAAVKAAFLLAKYKEGVCTNPSAVSI